MDLLHGAGWAGLGVAATGVLGLGWAVWGWRAARRGRPYSPWVTTMPLLLVAFWVAVGGIAALAVLRGPPDPQEDKAAAIFARAVGQVVTLPVLGWLAVVPMACVLCFAPARAGRAPWRSLAVAAGCVIVVIGAALLEPLVDRDAAPALVRIVPLLVAGAGMLRSLRCADAMGRRTATVAFAVLVGLGEAFALAQAQIEPFRCYASVQAETWEERLGSRRRDAELLAGLTLLVASVGALPARRAGARHELLAPTAVVCAAVLCDPAPWLRRAEAEAREDLASITVGVCVGEECGAVDRRHSSP